MIEKKKLIFRADQSKLIGDQLLIKIPSSVSMWLCEKKLSRVGGVRN